jgi:hypothetical protein
MIEKLTFNSLALDLVDIPAVSMPIEHSRQNLPSVALCCDKTAHFRVSIYCPKDKVHLCNDHALISAS